MQHSRTISNNYHNHDLLKLYHIFKIIFDTVYFKIKVSLKSLYSWRVPPSKQAMFKLLPHANQ